LPGQRVGTHPLRLLGECRLLLRQRLLGLPRGAHVGGEARSHDVGVRGPGGGLGHPDAEHNADQDAGDGQPGTGAAVPWCAGGGRIAGIEAIALQRGEQ